MDELTHLNFRDIWSDVISYLCFVDLKQLSQTNKYFYHTTKPFFKIIIKTIRECIERDYLIRQSTWTKYYWKHAVVSGSYLLKILTGSEWECDMDIIADFAEFPYNNDNLAHDARTLNHSSVKCPCLSMTFVNDDYPSLRFCDHVNTYKYCGRVLQICKVTKTPVVLISENFDFGFLKNMFNGSKLTILDMESLLTKTTSINKKDVINSNVCKLRIEKYRERGYTIHEV
jgi:hypothetical protein